MLKEQAILLILLLAFGLRVTNLGGQSLWYDEAYTLLLSSFPPDEILERTARDTNQPLYFWLLHLWGTPSFPESVTATQTAPGPFAELVEGAKAKTQVVDSYPRFPSVLAGTASVALVFAISRALLGAGPAAVAALFAAVSPFHVFYSQELRMYALLGVWNLLAVWGFLQGWVYGHRLGWALYTAATVLILYTHVLGVLVALAPLGWALLRRANWRALQLPLAALGASGVLYLPWAAVLAGQVETAFSTFWAAAPTPLSPFASLYLFFQGPFAGSLFPVALMAVLVALALTLPPMIPSPWRRRARSRRQAAGEVRDSTQATEASGSLQAPSLLWAWAILPLVALLALSLIRPLYLERVVIGAAFPVYMLLGWFFTRSRIGLTLGLLVLSCGLWGLRNWYVEPSFAKPPYRNAAALVKDLWAGEPVLHTSDGSYLPFLLYAPELPNRLLAGDPEAEARTSRARSTYHTLEVAPVALPDVGRFVLVISLDHSVEYQRTRAGDIDRRYRPLHEETVGGVIVRVYEGR